MTSFLTAFGLEVLLHGHTLWAKIPFGIVLAMMVLLVCWCAWTTLETEADYSLLSRAHILKEGVINFATGLRSKLSEHGPDAGDAGNGGGQGNTRAGMLSRSVVLKDAFNRLRLQRLTPRTVVNHPPDAAAAEMGGVGNNAPGSAV